MQLAKSNIHDILDIFKLYPIYWNVVGQIMQIRGNVMCHICWDWTVQYVVSLGTNCAPLVADLLLYSYEADFAHLQKSKFKKKP